MFKDNLKKRLRGEFNVQVLDAFGNVRREVTSPNLIVDQGLNLVGARAAAIVDSVNSTVEYNASQTYNMGQLIAKCYAGSGVTAVTPLDTGLDIEEASTTNRTGGTGTSVSGQETIQVVWRFAAGQIVSTITEVAVGPDGVIPGFPTNPIFSRVVLPSPIILGVDNVLQVTYTLTMTYDTSRTPFSLDITNGPTLSGTQGVYGFKSTSFNGYNFIALCSNERDLALVATDGGGDFDMPGSPLTDPALPPEAIDTDPTGATETRRPSIASPYVLDELETLWRFEYPTTREWSVEAKGLLLLPKTIQAPSILYAFNSAQSLTKDDFTTLEFFFNSSWINV